MLKLLERLVANKLTDYCEINSLEEPDQSAYRQGHSTETALLKITNHLLLNMDYQQISLLALLDMSAAFDTIPQSDVSRQAQMSIWAICICSQLV